jgi:hypothetical protein
MKPNPIELMDFKLVNHGNDWQYSARMLSYLFLQPVCDSMSTSLSDVVLSDFQKRLRSRAEVADFEVRLWRDAADRAETVYELSGSLSMLLHVKASLGEQPLWRLPHQLLLDLKASGHKWAVVLLHRSTERGYLLPAAEVSRLTESGQWPTVDHAHEVSASVARPAHLFTSSDELLFRLLTAGLI